MTKSNKPTLQARHMVRRTKPLNKSIDEEHDTVSFDYKDYSNESKQKQMTLNGGEFIRRFEQHIIPKGFTKIRTYGYLANRNRQQRINEVLKKMKLPGHKGLVKIPLKVRMIEQ